MEFMNNKLKYFTPKNAGYRQIWHNTSAINCILFVLQLTPQKGSHHHSQMEEQHMQDGNPTRYKHILGLGLLLGWITWITWCWVWLPYHFDNYNIKSAYLLEFESHKIYVQKRKCNMIITFIILPLWNIMHF